MRFGLKKSDNFFKPGGIALQPFQRVSSSQQNIPLNIHAKCEYHINDERRPQGKEGNVNKPQADA